MSNELEAKRAKIEKSTLALSNDVRELKIFDEASEEKAIDLLGAVSAYLKRIEDLRKTATKPLVDQKKAADNLAKMFSEPLERMQAGIKGALKQYMDAKAAAAAAEAAKIRAAQLAKEKAEQEKLAAAQRQQAEAERKEAEALRAANDAKTKKAREAAWKKADEAAAAAKVEATKAAEAQQALDTKEIVMVEEAPKSVRTASGAMATRKLIWTYKIVAHEIVPMDYLCIDEKAVKEAIRQGVREIPGIEIYQESDISSRS